MKTTDTEPQDEDMAEEVHDSGGIDSIIETVESYIENPELVTPETLSDLHSQLLDLKEYLDGSDTQDTPPEDYEEKDDGEPGLVIAIGKAKKRGMK